MASDITPELRQAIDATHGAPLELVDRQTDEHYVVIRAELYVRLKSVLDLGSLTDEERKSQLQQWGQRAGWEDPAASAFDDLKPRS